MKPRLLDLFCGAGGAARGYQRAGFYVVGVDIKPQPRYAGDEFVQGDALDVLRLLVEQNDRDEPLRVLGLQPGGDGEGFLAAGGDGGLHAVDADHVAHASDSPKPAFRVKDFEAIHASPPCQAFTSLRVMHNARAHDDLLTPTRALLERVGLPYVIENVPGAPIATLTRLCGTSFGLGVSAYDGWRQLRRHRYFETSFPLLSPPCQHDGPTIGLYGDHARDRRRNNGQAGRDFPDKDKLELGRRAMDMPWAEKWREITEAIPPAFTEYVGFELMQHVRAVAA